MWHLLLLDCNNGYANAPQYYVIRILPVLLYSLQGNVRVTSFGNASINVNDKK